MIGQQKNYRILCHQHYHLIDKPVITFYGCKSICISELSWNFLKNVNAQVTEFFFFCQSSSYASNQQRCLKKSGLYEDRVLLSSLFHFFYFICRAPVSFSLCFPISPSLLFFFFLMFFLKHSRKAFVYKDIICILYIFLKT